MPTPIPFSYILRKGFTLTCYKNDKIFRDINYYRPYQKAYELILLMNDYYKTLKDNKISELNNIEKQISQLKENYFEESVAYPKIEAELNYLWYSYSLITLMFNTSYEWKRGIFNHPLLLQITNSIISLKSSEHFLEKLPPLCEFAYKTAKKISQYLQIVENFNTRKIRPVLQNRLEKELIELKNEISVLILQGIEYIQDENNRKHIQSLLEDKVHIIKSNEIFKIIKDHHWESWIEDRAFKVLMNLKPIYIFFPESVNNYLRKTTNRQFIPSLSPLLTYFSRLDSFKQLDRLQFLENYNELVDIINLSPLQPIYFMRDMNKLSIEKFCIELDRKIDEYKILCDKRIDIKKGNMEPELENNIGSLHRNIMRDIISALFNRIYQQYNNIIANTGNHPNASDINQLDKEIEQLFSIYNDARVQNLSADFFGLQGNIDWKGNIIASEKILPLDGEITKDLKRFNTDSSDNTHLSNYPDSLFSKRSTSTASFTDIDADIDKEEVSTFSADSDSEVELTPLLNRVTL